MRNSCTREWFVLVLAFLMLLAKSVVHSQNTNTLECSLLNNATLCEGSQIIVLGSGTEDAMLSCSGIAQVNTDFVWYFKPLFDVERRIETSSKYALTEELDRTLTVRNISVNDTGMYFCRRIVNGEVTPELVPGRRCLIGVSPALFSMCSKGESVVQVGCDALIIITKEESQMVEFSASFSNIDKSLSCISQQVDDVSLFKGSIEPDNKLYGCSAPSREFSCTDSSNNPRLSYTLHGGSNVTFTFTNLTLNDTEQYILRATLRYLGNNAQENIYKNFSLSVTEKPTTTPPTETASSTNIDGSSPTGLSNGVLAAIITVIIVLLCLLAWLGFAVVYLILWTYYWKKKTKDGERIYDSPMVVFRRSKKKNKKQNGPYNNRQSTHSINEEDKVVLHPDVNLSAPPEKV